MNGWTGITHHPALVLSPGRTREIEGIEWLSRALADRGYVVLDQQYRNGDVRYYGRDPEGIRFHVSGHSSGGHLAGVVLTTDWPKDFNLPVDTVKGGLCCSGTFDLKPVRLSARRKYINFTDEMEHALSPQRHLDKLNAPVIAAHGTLESPEFQRRRATSRPLGKRQGSRYSSSSAYNHFEIIETLGDPYGALGRAVLQQMQLARA